MERDVAGQSQRAGQVVAGRQTHRPAAGLGASVDGGLERRAVVGVADPNGALVTNIKVEVRTLSQPGHSQQRQQRRADVESE